MSMSVTHHHENNHINDQVVLWAEKIANGDLDSEKRICEHFLNRYKSNFLQQGYSIHPFEDASQDALISLIETLRNRGLKQLASINGYFHTCVKYRLWHFRKKLRRTESLDSCAAIAQDEPDCIEYLSTRRELDLVVERLALLTKKRDREILIKRFFEEQSIESICSELNLTKQHFYRVLHRARKRLLALM